MEYLRKAFLFSVGVIAIAYDEISKSIEEAIKNAEEQRERISSQFAKPEA